MNNKIIIGICGGTASGKTTLAHILMDFYKNNACMISLDSYYNDINHLSFSKRELINFDDPKALDFELIVSHLNKLFIDEKIEVPMYDFNSHRRLNRTSILLPKDIIILEGIHILYNPIIRKMINIKIFIDVDDNIRMKRRIKRDVNKRSRTLKSIINQYKDTVKPMYMKYVDPVKIYSDIILPKGGKNSAGIDLIKIKIDELLYKVKI